MEAEKYYTPSIEEFHLGFEFNIQFQTEDKSSYRTISVFDGKHIDFINKELKVGRVRVKYLDREDIESLGWKLFSGEDTYSIKLKDFRGRGDMECHLCLRKTVLIFVGDLETPWSEWKTLFTGKIKNKSELKKIMQMLSIT